MTSLQHTHSANEGLDHVASDGGLRSKNASLPRVCAPPKRTLSAPSGAFAKKQWKAAALKIKDMPDPWEGYVRSILYQSPMWWGRRSSEVHIKVYSNVQTDQDILKGQTLSFLQHLEVRIPQYSGPFSSGHCWDQKSVLILVRCPDFRGYNVHKQGVLEK